MTVTTTGSRSALVHSEIREAVSRLDIPFSQYGIDPYGVSRGHLEWFYTPLAWLYRNYFRVEAQGIDNVPAKGRVVLAGNHAGGVAVDGGMVLTSLLLDAPQPRLGHAMAEKFTSQFPVMAEWFGRVGQLTGVPDNAVRLLEDDRALVVFPEGARGTAKLFWQRNSLVEFGTGFVRLALQTGAPIVPFAFIGAGKALPTVVNLRRLGKLFGAPYIPVTPYLLPIPLPTKCKIIYGKPVHFDGDGHEADEIIQGYVAEVKSRIATLIALGTGEGTPPVEPQRKSPVDTPRVHLEEVTS